MTAAQGWMSVMRPARIHRLLHGGALDLVLAAFVATLSLLVGLTSTEPLGVIVDLAACVAAALAVRWPRAAGAALAAILLVYLSSPVGWAESGEYAALIPVLGTGIRGQRRERLALTVAYWLILSARQLIAYPDFLRGATSSLVWALLFALMWLLGGALAAFQRAEEQARLAALAEQRLSLARDLHDTVARSLARISRQAYEAASEDDPSQMRTVADQLGEAAGQLRWVLGSLRSSDPDAAPITGGSLATAVRESVQQLQARGFEVTTSIEGSLDDVPPEPGAVLADIVKEAAANIERHGAVDRPCMLIVSVDDLAADLALINEVIDGGSPAGSARPLGLLGAAERLALVGGQLQARQEGTHWITRATVPIQRRT